MPLHLQALEALLTFTVKLMTPMLPVLLVK